MEDIFTKIKNYPKDLIEIHFTGLTEASWRSLFEWANRGKVKRLFNQRGVDWDGHLDIEAYLEDRASYMFNFEMDGSGREYTFLLISLDEATIDIDQGDEVSTEVDLKEVLSDLIQLAEILCCSTFHMCPESNTDHIVYQWDAVSTG